MEHSGKSVRKNYRHPLAEALSPILSAPPFALAPDATHRPRRWQPLLLVWTALLMAWDGGASLAEQFESARTAVTAMFPWRPRVGQTYQGFVRAMGLWGAALLDRLTEHLRGQLRAMTSCWTVMGLQAFAVDGSRVECPRTADNQQRLKRAGRKKTGPQLSLTTFYHMGSGCPWDFRIGPGVENERTHLRAMLPTLPPEALIVADAGFSGYDLLHEVLSSGRHVLFRVGSNVRLLQKLGFARIENDSTVYLWPQEVQHKNGPPLVLRLVVLHEGHHRVYLVTDVPEEGLSLEQASVLYRLRWGVEVFYRSLKQTLEHRKMRSRAAAEARRELQWAMAALWVLSVRGAQEIVARGKTPHALSIALARKLFRQAMAGRCRAGLNLGRRLGRALKDTYVRQGSKSARNWPHKKNPKPAGPPNIGLATAKQVRRAQKVRLKNLAA